MIRNLSAVELSLGPDLEELMDCAKLQTFRGAMLTVGRSQRVRDVVAERAHTRIKNIAADGVRAPGQRCVLASPWSSL